MNKPILALDSSAHRLSFALGGAGQRTVSASNDTDLSHAETIIVEIDRLLKEAGLSPSDLGALAYGAGPGSFTGLRVGLSVIKAFSMVRSTPTFSASSLDLIAEHARPLLSPDTRFVRVLVDARRFRYYTSLYVRTASGALEKKEADGIKTADEIRAALVPHTTLTGDGLKTFPLDSARDRALATFPESVWYPDAAALVEWVKQGSPFVKPVSLREVLPAYLRVTEPEERLLKEGRNSGC